MEEELEEMRRIRKDLDAKNVFLHFTQEQLNAQVVSLETVVKNLKTENHLLNKGLKSRTRLQIGVKKALQWGLLTTKICQVMQNLRVS